MKRAFSILFAALILLSGLHFTVATHTCCGQLAAVKYSVTGEKATCGMEESQSPVPVNGEIKSDCCKNKISACSSDGNYFSTTNVQPEVTSIPLPDFAVAPDFLVSVPLVAKTLDSLPGPPPLKTSASVDQSLICVFII